MKAPLLLAIAFCLSLTPPSLAQGSSGQQQQQHQQEKKQTKQTQQQNKQRPQQQGHQQSQSHARPQAPPQQRTQPQQQARPQNRGHFTAPPPPQRHTQRNFQPRYYRYPDGRIDRTPRYYNDTWYGRAAPNDVRFRLHQPYAHGRYYLVGPRYYHRIVRFNRARYWFWLSSGYYFQIAYWDWPYCANWCWDCGDQFMIYLDPDHPGWYLVLNVQTGVFVHAIFMGR